MAACTTKVTQTEPAPIAPSGEMPTEGEEASLGKTPPLRQKTDARVIAALREGGLDVKNLPEDLDELVAEPDHERLHAVMESFKIALGTTCDGCHVKGAQTSEAFKTSTPRKEIAKKMWKRFVVALKREDGSALYCDSCHQGKMTFLDVTDKESLARWMNANFVTGIVRKDGAEHGCVTCHGDRDPTAFLEEWKTPDPR